MDTTLYARIRERREALEMSQTELAELLGYSDRSAIAKIEKGVNDITQSKIEAFAKALHTTPAYLMGWTSDWYDYEADEDSRFDEIPTAQLERLKTRYDNNLREIWNAWVAMQEDAYDDSLQNRIPAVSFRQLENYSPKTIEKLIVIADSLEELNSEGQEKLLDYATDLVASGRYIKSYQSEMDKKQA